MNQGWLQYKFQFNNDETSCLALSSLIKEGWSIEGFKAEDGYSWLELHKEKYT